MWFGEYDGKSVEVRIPTFVAGGVLLPERDSELLAIHLNCAKD